MRIVLIGIKSIVMVEGTIVDLVLQMGAETFECHYCKNRFVPTINAY